MTIERSSWIVTAYAAAVEGGYSGSYEQFCLGMAKMANIDQSVEAAELFALIAEAYAKGTHNGLPVSSSEPGYHDNSFYYSEIAKNNKIDAKNARDDAVAARKDSEAYAKGTRNGTPVTSGDAAYQNNAKYYSGLAEGYRDDALTYKTACETFYNNMQYATDSEVSQIITDYGT